jgi:hypothetical protein
MPVPDIVDWFAAVASVAAWTEMTNNRCSSEMLGDCRHQYLLPAFSLVLKKIETA